MDLTFEQPAQLRKADFICWIKNVTVRQLMLLEPATFGTMVSKSLEIGIFLILTRSFFNIGVCNKCNYIDSDEKKMSVCNMYLDERGVKYQMQPQKEFDPIDIGPYV